MSIDLIRSKFERQTVLGTSVFLTHVYLFTNFGFRMPRRGGGKRIRMDDPVPMEYEEEMYRGAG